MTDEEPIPEISPDEEADAAIVPDVEFGDQEEAQVEVWQENAREGGV